MNAGRDFAVGQRKHRFDEAGHAGGGVGMAEVGFGRANGAVLATAGSGSEGPGQGGDLNRVAEKGAGAVGLDVVDGVALDAGQAMSGGDHGRLAVLARSGVADLGPAVVVDGGGSDYGQDVVVVVLGIGQSLEHDNAAALTQSGSLGPGIECSALPRR